MHLLRRFHSNKKVSMSFSSVLSSVFPGTMKESTLVAHIAEQLKGKGFTKDNCISLVGGCRDEICGTLDEAVNEHFGDSFCIRGLGGFIFCGNTGFGAAHHHSPLISGKDKYVYFAAAHIGVAEDGTIGACTREGREPVSSACGALVGFHKAFLSGSAPSELNMADLEMTVLSKLLEDNIPAGTTPDLAETTKIAAKVIAEHQLEEIIKATVDTSKADYAVIVGVQIHGPGLKNSYFYPLPEYCYSVVDGTKEQISLD